MWNQIGPGLRLTLWLTVLTGIVYPLATTGLCQAIFPTQSNGSLITAQDHVIGSDLIGQSFSWPEYFQPRPSAAGNDGYDATASGGSNFGPTNKKLYDRVKASVEKFRKDNPTYTGPIPADLVTASASGLDPHLSPASAMAQAARVAAARGTAPAQIESLIAQSTEQPALGILGDPRVNVLRLNLALDRSYPVKR
jgi:potassium-transporting ATPase KdpC subunit